MMTTLEIVLITALVILTIQYLTTTYAFLVKENSVNTAITTMEDMQKYNHELFQKLLKEEKLTITLANKLKAYQDQYGTGGESKITGLQ